MDVSEVEIHQVMSLNHLRDRLLMERLFVIPARSVMAGLIVSYLIDIY